MGDEGLFTERDTFGYCIKFCRIVSKAMGRFRESFFYLIIGFILHEEKISANGSFHRIDDEGLGTFQAGGDFQRSHILFNGL